MTNNGLNGIKLGILRSESARRIRPKARDGKFVMKAIIPEISELVVVAGKATSNRVRSVHRFLSLRMVSVDD
jgi:hypothetical protein